MNNKRREAIRKFEDIKSQIETIREEEESVYDNMPEVCSRVRKERLHRP